MKVMELIQETLEKIVYSVTSREIDKRGFDSLWDEIRNIHGANKFDVLSISADKNNNNIYFIELAPKKN